MLLTKARKRLQILTKASAISISSSKLLNTVPRTHVFLVGFQKAPTPGSENSQLYSVNIKLR